MPDNFELGQHIDDLDGTLQARMLDIDGIESKLLLMTVDNGIRLRWNVDGHLAGLIAGNWQFEAAFEKIGGGGGEFSVTAGPLAYAPGQQTFTIPVPAGTITEPGPYKVVAMLSFYDLAGNPTFINGFVEIPMVRFH